ncbi:amino acid transporter AVT1J-like [Anneissia japonica]|uniref:amino acid transporter AVT1J-like n=1 Tax=Anneissia japonica TaxID=1529436 RepID=UPI001425A2BA|nr:amino acid transporter AVT1J-like [Anneissia japonica]XP_033113776.1 amino acid transporter AVT1J-like [Anneissia japonica]
MSLQEKSPLINEGTTAIKGLTIVTAGVFIVGEMAGSGVLALPKAVADTGWIGIVLIIVCAMASCYTAIILGRCWMIIQNRFPRYKEHVRYPYPAIGYEAFGNSGKHLVTFCVNFTLFGVSTVFLLIASENIQSLISHSLSFCAWLPVIAAILCPFTWLGTPKDFWAIAVGAMSATVLACLLMFIQILMDISINPDPHHSNTSFKKFFVSFGTILFAFGGHAAFPTIQHDMRRPADFKWGVMWSYAVIVLMYLPVAASGYFVYGDKLETDPNGDIILAMLSPGGIATTVTVMITAHLTFGYIIVINPLCQQVEEWLGVKQEFGIKRCIIRSIVVACNLFVAETIPHFGAILSLVGGSTVVLLTFVFPSLFYIRLLTMESDDGPQVIALHDRVIHYEIILIGIIGGIASTYSAIDDMASGASSFTVPCYVNASAAHL